MMISLIDKQLTLFVHMDILIICIINIIALLYAVLLSAFVHIEVFCFWNNFFEENLHLRIGHAQEEFDF